ncbi:hypothetical protein [Paraburkholderia sediminicola]|uniref:hypothetical protein n=1 Tax=Paraburkholderia sediminicola TaxID=458836 RepID=UPI0038B9EA75
MRVSDEVSGTRAGLNGLDVPLRDTNRRNSAYSTKFYRSPETATNFGGRLQKKLCGLPRGSVAPEGNDALPALKNGDS